MATDVLHAGVLLQDLAFRQLTEELIGSFKHYIADCDDQTLVIEIVVVSLMHTCTQTHTHTHTSQSDEKDEDCFGLAVATRRLLAIYKWVAIHFHGDVQTVTLSVCLCVGS